MSETAETTSTFTAAADYYRSRVLEDDGNHDRSRERQDVTVIEERIRDGQSLSAEQHELATHVLGRYLGFLARGGYSGQTPVAREQIEAVHAAQAVLALWPQLEPLTLADVDPDATYLREAEQIERERLERLGLAPDPEL